MIWLYPAFHHRPAPLAQAQTIEQELAMVASTASQVPSRIFVDSHNIDGVLRQVLGHCPESHQRPRWDRVKDHLCSVLPFEGKPNFVIDRDQFKDKVFPRHRALRQMGYEVQVVEKVGQYADNDDPVDEFILDQLHAIRDLIRRGESIRVAVVSHDHIYADVLKEIMDAGGEVVVVGFREELHPDLLGLEGDLCEIHDLEHDVGAFNYRLPRPYRPDYSDA
jgi:uncharacterized protein